MNTNIFSYKNLTKSFSLKKMLSLLNGEPYVNINAILGGIPVYVTSMKYTTTNTTTSNTTFLGEELVDNISIGPYTITLDLICFGNQYLQELKNLYSLAKERRGNDCVISLIYDKSNETYSNLIITQMDFTDVSNTIRMQKVSLTLKSIKIGSINDIEAKPELTNTIINDFYHVNKTPVLFEATSNLNAELQKLPQFKEV